MVLKKLMYYSGRHGWLFLGSLLLIISYLFYFLPAFHAKVLAYTGGTGSIDSTFLATPEALYELVAGWGAEGRSSYIADRLSFDILWPISFTMLHFFAISWLWFRCRKDEWLMVLGGWLALLPFAFDMGENILAMRFVYLFPEKNLLLGQWLSVMTTSKWVTVLMVETLLLVFIFTWIKKQWCRVSSSASRDSSQLIKKV